MSEERVPDAIWRFWIAGINGRKLLRIELFLARQWKITARIGKRNRYPWCPMRGMEYWTEYYRLRINGRWRQKEGYRFRFFTLVESLELVEQLKIKA
ncbi:MAG: hypothetical protein JKY62_17510 [Desulfocapsa sp.]|nr:hypothetical protein [Desulfocapsa sp.]